MKKLALFILATIITAMGFSQTNLLDIVTVKKIKVDVPITSLKVYNNIEVVLQDDKNSGIEIAGEKNAVESTTVKFIGGELIITQHEAAYNENVIVYVPANYLGYVYIQGASKISSYDTLHNEAINVVINGEGKSSIKSKGLVTSNTIGDLPLDSLLN
ncbi:hypothetical protein BH11BAC3_BH11BAC3_26770 [soil metagenome]